MLRRPRPQERPLAELPEQPARWNSDFDAGRRSIAAAAAARAACWRRVRRAAAADPEALLEPDADDRRALPADGRQHLPTRICSTTSCSELTRLNLEIAGPQEPRPPAPGPSRVPGAAGEDAGDDGAGAQGSGPGETARFERQPADPARVHQLLAALAYGDAIGNEALAIQRPPAAGGLRVRHLRRARPSAHGAAWRARSGSTARSRRRRRSASSTSRSAAPPGRLIYHAPDRLVSIYHNITPADWFLGFHPAPGRPLLPRPARAGRLRPRTELALGDSEFNRRELEAAGFARTGVLPDRARPRRSYRRPASPVMRRLYDDGAHEHPLRGPHHPRTRGSTTSSACSPCTSATSSRRSRPAAGRATTAATSGTTTACRSWCASCGRDEVVFTGPGGRRRAAAPATRWPTCFLCLSEHEGFCVPLLEAMAFGVPVVAYDAGAVRGDAARRRRCSCATRSRRRWPGWCAACSPMMPCGARDRDAGARSRQVRGRRLRRACCSIASGRCWSASAPRRPRRAGAGS